MLNSRKTAKTWTRWFVKTRDIKSTSPILVLSKSEIFKVQLKRESAFILIDIFKFSCMWSRLLFDKQAARDFHRCQLFPWHSNSNTQGHYIDDIFQGKLIDHTIFTVVPWTALFTVNIQFYETFPRHNNKWKDHYIDDLFQGKLIDFSVTYC